MAAKDANLSLPMKPRPWWQVFVGHTHEKDLSTICNALVALQDERISGDAFRTFLPSLLSEQSHNNANDNGFNDPGSFLWNLMDLEETMS